MDEAALILPARHKLTVDDFYRMAEAGILRPEDRVELIDGAIIDMAPTGQSHNAVVGILTRVLVQACGDRAIVWPQNSIQLDRFSAPQPDFTILRPRADFYLHGDRPGPEDVLLMVEAADTSLRYDRTVKLPLYARAGIPEYWIMDLKARVLDTYRQPSANGYADHTSCRMDERLPLAAAPDIVIPLGLLFS